MNDKWMAIPTWFLTNLLIPFLPEHHKWHGRYFTLQDWYDGQTPECKQLDFIGWLLAVQIVMLAILSAQVR